MADAGAASQALTLDWVCGLSAQLPTNLINLSDGVEGSERIAYAAAHTAVLLDRRTGQQQHLQGHRAAISCLAASSDRAVLVTADASSDASLLVLWDPATCQPLRTLERPHAAGVRHVAFSADGALMATLSAVAEAAAAEGEAAAAPEQAAAAGDASQQQEVALWDVRQLLCGTTASSSEAGASASGELLQQQQPAPLARGSVPPGDVQAWLVFNSDDASELASNGEQRAFFWRSQLADCPSGGGSSSEQLSYCSPPLRPGDFKQPVGAFVASVFVPGSSQALTSTVDGDVVVWDEPGGAGGASSSGSSSSAGRPRPRRALKLIRLHGGAIRHLSSVGNFVVTGGADGLVRFFDARLRLCAWFEDLHAPGPITAVSFAAAPCGCGAPPTATMQLGRFVAPNFVVSTASGKIIAVTADAFNDPDQGPGGELLLRAPASCLLDVAAHPLRPELLLLAGDSDAERSSSAGASQGSARPEAGASSAAHGLAPAQQALLRWDLVSRSCVASRQLPAEQRVTRLVLARDGGLLVLGCAGGQVAVLQGDSLAEVVALRHTKHGIVRLSMSADSRFVAAADAAGQVLLYGHVRHKGLYCKWDLIGKFMAHHRPVVGLHFGEAPSGQTRLFSLGSDQRLIEYDLAGATAAGAGLRALSVRDCVPPGGAGAPTAMCFAPPMAYFSANATDTLLLVADDAFKLKAYNPDDARPGATATYLGPTFGGPITRLLPFRSVSDGGATPWLAYASEERVVGLISWPLSLDSRRSMGVIAHPGPVRGLALTFDGRQLITLGTQGVLNAWSVDTSALLPRPASAAAAAGAAGAPADAPDWGRLVGDAALLEELRDLFCYAQLMSQPLDAPGGLDVSGRVPVEALPDLLRAAGCYPSAADVDALAAHVRFLADLAPADEGEAAGLGGSVAGGGRTTGPAPGPGASGLGAAPEGVGLAEFLTLYLSHRPVVELSLGHIEAAFNALAGPGSGGVLSSQRLLELLQSGDEALSREELAAALQVLTGADTLEATLPEAVDAAAFAVDVLGFEAAATA